LTHQLLVSINSLYGQTIETTNQLDDFANYSTLYNTHNTKGDIAFAQKVRFNDYTSLQGSSGLNIVSTTSRFISADTDDSASIMLVIWDDSLGVPNNKLYEEKVMVGNGQTFVDVTTDIDLPILVSDSFFIGYEPVAGDTIQFYVSQIGCGCSNAYLQETGGNWRTIVDRHSSQDLNLYFEITFAATVDPPITSFTFQRRDTLTVDFYNTSIGEMDSIVWDFGNGDTSNDLNPTYRYGDTGNYIVCLTAYNDGGSDTYCDTVRIGIAMINNSISDINKPRIVTYPAPFNDYLNISYDGLNRVVIYDLNGKMVSQYDNINSKTFNINTNKLDRGGYLLLLNNDEFKLVIKL
jgi:PKD repeat protein